MSVRQGCDSRICMIGGADGENVIAGAAESRNPLDSQKAMRKIVG